MATLSFIFISNMFLSDLSLHMFPSVHLYPTTAGILVALLLEKASLETNSRNNNLWLLIWRNCCLGKVVYVSTQILQVKNQKMPRIWQANKCVWTLIGHQAWKYALFFLCNWHYWPLFLMFSKELLFILYMLCFDLLGFFHGNVPYCIVGYKN